MASIWEALLSRSDRPAIVDATLGYVDYTPGEKPSEVSTFLYGRPPREVHIMARAVKAPETPEECDALCRSLFADKERVLLRFYGPLASDGAPDIAALGCDASAAFEELPGACCCMLLSW